MRPVQGRNRNKIEDHQDRVDKDEHKKEIDQQIRLPQKRRQQLKEYDSDNNAGQIGQRSGQRDYRLPQPAAAEIGRIDRHRFGPAEAGHQQKDESEGIDMNQRIESQPATDLGGIVTKKMGRPAVRKFMDGQGDQNREDPGDKEQRLGKKPSERHLFELTIID